jgi:hypothetical protein
MTFKEYIELYEKKIPKNIIKQLKDKFNSLKIAAKNNQKFMVKIKLKEIEEIAKKYNISNDELGDIQYPK